MKFLSANGIPRPTIDFNEINKEDIYEYVNKMYEELYQSSKHIL